MGRGPSFGAAPRLGSNYRACGACTRATPLAGENAPAGPVSIATALPAVPGTTPGLAGLTTAYANRGPENGAGGGRRSRAGCSLTTAIIRTNPNDRPVW